MSSNSRGADEMRRVRSVGFLSKGIRCSYIVGFGNWFRIPNFDTIYVKVAALGCTRIVVRVWGRIRGAQHICWA
jgi:hypothetical protein